MARVDKSSHGRLWRIIFATQLSHFEMGRSHEHMWRQCDDVRLPRKGIRRLGDVVRIQREGIGQQGEDNGILNEGPSR